MKRIGVLTSGGDAPGMNAAIRAVVRAGYDRGWDVFGIRWGFAGLIAGEARQIGVRDVGGIIQQGGTILGSARCREFETTPARLEAVRFIHRLKLEALVVIGGNGSQRGAYELSRLDVPVVGIAATIDNDVYGTDISIGADTALNVALEAIDRLKITAASHGRAFLLEVMGRDCGYLALMTGIAGGAETIVIPEAETDPETMTTEIISAYERGKGHAIVVVSEGARCNAEARAKYFSEHSDRLRFELRVTKLGHVQRGASPRSIDRLMASRLGMAAIGYLAGDEYGVLVGQQRGEIGITPLSDVVSQRKTLDLSLLDLAEVLAK